MTDKKSTEYKTWFHMISRCNNGNDPNYNHYGGRGIKVCDEWLNSFEAFYAYMGKKPKGRYSIDRIDVNGNYEPGNVRWATPKEQTRNRRMTKKATHNGETKAVAELCENLNADYEAVRKRMQFGWSFDRAINEECHNEIRKFDWEGTSYTVKELAEKFGMLKSVLSNRINMGWDLEKCLKTPVEDKEWEITINGRTQNMKDWAKEYKIPYKCLHLRITRFGWSIEKALNEPLRSENKIDFNGKRMTLSEWAKETGIAYATLSQRLRMGWSVEKALSKKISRGINKDNTQHASSE